MTSTAVAATELPRRYRGVSDDEFFARAQEDGRVVVTDNVRDFMSLAAAYESRGETHRGVVLALRPAFDRARPGVVGEMVRALSALAAEWPGKEGSVLFLRPVA